MLITKILIESCRTSVRLHWSPLRCLQRDIKWQSKLYLTERRQIQTLHRQPKGIMGQTHIPCPEQGWPNKCPQHLLAQNLWLAPQWGPNVSLQPLQSTSIPLPNPFFLWLLPSNDTNTHTRDRKAGLSLYKVLMWAGVLPYTLLHTSSTYQE